MVSKILTPILNLFRFHKKKIAAFLGFFILFAYIFFPFNDLGDLVAVKVSELTSGQVYVSFDTLSLSLLPQPGLSLGQVSVETAMFPALSAKTLSVAPSMTGLMTFKPGVSIYAEKLLGGDLSLSTRGGDKNSAGHLKQKLNLDLSEISLGEITKLTQLPINLSGSATGNVEAQVDPEFSDQPQGQIDLKAERVSLNESSITTMMGPMSLPKVNIQNLVLQAKMDKGVLDITKLTVGVPNGDIFANVTGKLDLKLERFGPRFGGYDFSIRLQVGESFKQKMSTYLGFLSAYQTGPNQYGVKVSGMNMYGPPSSMTKLQ